jgi:hypothetical protein
MEKRYCIQFEFLVENSNLNLGFLDDFGPNIYLDSDIETPYP